MDEAITRSRPTDRRPWLRIVAAISLAFTAGMLAMAFGVRLLPTVIWPGAAARTDRAAAVAPAPPAPPAMVVVRAAGPAPVDPAALLRQQAALAAELGTLEARTAALRGDADAAGGRATHAEALLIAFAARRTLDRGLALGYLEEQLRRRFSGQPQAVATIIDAARDPVTLADLKLSLDAVAPVMATGAASGWWASFRHELAGLIVIHRGGSPSPLPGDRLARARLLLDVGRVDAALTEVAHLPGGGDTSAWSGAARRYVGARQALDLIEEAAITGDASPAAQATASPR